MLIPNSLKDLCDWQVSAMKEKHIIAYDPSNASFNYGDRIISQSAISQLNCIARDDCDAIENKINSTFDTDVKINIDAINQWKSQF